MEFNGSEVSRYFSSRFPHLKQVGKSWRMACPIHNGKDLNFSVDPETGMCFCHSSCGNGFDILSLEMALFGLDFAKAKTEVFNLLGKDIPRGIEINIDQTFDYTDEHGNLIYQTVRLRKPNGDKDFKQRRKGPDGKWIWNLQTVTQVPFKLPELVAWKGFTYIAEGEKCCLSLIRRGWFATTNSGGATHFSPDLVKWFEGRHVGILPDNDEKGRKHAEMVAALLHPVVASVRIIELPGLPLKGDVHDWLESGKTADELYELVEDTPVWFPGWKFVNDLPHENDKYLSSFGQYVDRVGGIDEFWKLADIEGLNTPFKPLTEDLGGMRKGEIYVLAANAGAGKSSLALQFAATALANRSGVLYFSMEMGHKEIFQRMAAIGAHVDLKDFKRIRKYNDDPAAIAEIMDRLRASSKTLSRAPLLVSTKGAITTKFMVDEAKRLKNNGVGIIIVDHAQLMGSEERNRSEYEKFTAISRALKGIASDLDVPLLLISQTSRRNNVEQRFELEISDMRATGAWEEDAAAVMLLYYDKDDFKLAKDTDTDRLKRGPLKAWIKLGKNRYGESNGYVALNHFKALTRFDLCDTV